MNDLDDAQRRGLAPARCSLSDRLSGWPRERAHGWEWDRPEWLVESGGGRRQSASNPDGRGKGSVRSLARLHAWLSSGAVLV